MSDKESILSAERLRELLDYDPATGIFKWKVLTRSSRATLGKPITASSHGYLVVGIARRLYPLHRLAWLYVTGAWPTGDIDHKNGIKHDNRWVNLRDGTTSFNIQNRHGPNSNSRSGFLGVSPNRDKWMARIYLPGGKLVYLGNHETPEAAYATYVKAKRELHAGCTL